MLDAHDKIRAARRYLFTRKPFYGSLLAEIDSKGGVKPDPAAKSMVTDGRTIRYAPKFVNGLTVDEVTGVLAHELLHIAMGHTLRRRGRSAHLWNIGADWAINDVLLKDGFKLPEGGQYAPADHKDKAAEANYDHLKSEYDDRPPGLGAPQSDNNQTSDEDSDEKSPGSSGGSGEPDEDEDGEQSEQPGDGDAGDGSDDGDTDEGSDGSGQGKRRPQSGAGGGGDAEDSEDADDTDDPADDGTGDDEDDEPNPVNGDEEEDDDPGGGSSKPEIKAPKWGDVEDTKDENGKELDDATREKMIRQQALTLVEAIRGAGKDAPEALQRMVNETIAGKADWRDILKQFYTDTMKNDVSWRRPNRRFIGQNVYLPSPDGVGLGEQVIVLDVSGSIRDQDLKRFQREVRKQLVEVPPTKLHIIWHDDTVLKHVEHTAGYDQISLSGPGGGGTDFACVPEFLAEKGIRPKCMVWFTDLETYRWPPDPLIPTLFVVWPMSYSWGKQQTETPWGAVALMENENDERK